MAKNCGLLGCVSCLSISWSFQNNNNNNNNNNNKSRMAWWNFICRYDDDDDDDDEDDDEFGFNDASTHEGHLRQNCISTWFS